MNELLFQPLAINDIFKLSIANRNFPRQGTPGRHEKNETVRFILYGIKKVVSLPSISVNIDSNE
jgi:hypothetical protein